MTFHVLLELKNKLEKEFRKYFPKRISSLGMYIQKFRSLSGLEIGGPSYAFNKSGFLPLYQHIKKLDGCNFSTNTIWEGEIESGKTYHYENGIGHQFILDGSDLSEIADNKYDFVFSSHNLEHIANPIKALLEWRRVLKNEGYLLLILPNKLGTFDIKREYTSFEHILEDYNSNITEADTTHIEEILKLHDHTKNPISIGISEFEELIKDNYTTRAAHHHVFDQHLIKKMLEHINFEVLSTQFFSSIHIVTLAKAIKS